MAASEGAETKDMNSCWTIGDSPGCGEGVFATRTIKAGEEVGFAKSIPAKNESWQVLIEKPLLTFPSVKHAIVKDGVVQHQVMQRWAVGTYGDTNHAESKSETQNIFAVHSFISLWVTPYIQQITRVT